MARSSANQIVQMGLEAPGSPGAKVAATRRLGGFTLEPKVEAEVAVFRPKGVKYPTVQAANQEWSSAELSGPPTFDEIVVPLSGALCAPTVTQVMDDATGTPAYRYDFAPKSSGPDNVSTWTVEIGEPGGTGERLGYGLFTDFDLEISRAEVNAGGTLMGQVMERGFTLTPGLETPALVPILPGQFTITLADDQAAFGAGETTTLTSVVSAHLQIGGRHNPVWYVNAAMPSFTTHVEAPEPDFTVDFVAEANADGIAWLDRMQTGAFQFLQFRAVGPVLAAKADFPGLAADVHYEFVWETTVAVSDPGDFSDEDGVYAIGPTFTVMHDTEWDAASHVTVTCGRTTLA